MKYFLLLLLAASLGAITYTSAQGGIKSKALGLQFFKHDAAKGFLDLENKLGRKLQAHWSNENSTPSFVGGKLTSAGYSTSADKSDDAVRFLSDNSELFGIKNPEQELKLKSSFTDELSMTHIKYDQAINGIRIYPSQLIIHFNSDGSVESVNGHYIPTPILNTTPSIQGSTALSIAKRILGNYKAASESSELILFRNALNMLLAYEVNLPSADFPAMKLIIDAKSGALLEKDSGIRYDGPVVGTGIGLNGSTRTLNTYLETGKYYMLNAALGMYVPPIDSFKGVIEVLDAHNDTAGNGYQSASLVTDPNNDNNFNDNIGLRAAVDAHFFVEKTYNFFKAHYNRNSFDNLGGSLINVVHYKRFYNNAYWNGLAMTFGDGDGIQFSNLCGALDVTAHELAHGVTGTTAQLVYHVQPGAINESMSDVFASVIDSTNWLLAEDIYTPGIPGDALRNMQDPHNGSSPGSNEWQPAHMDEYVVLPDDEENDWGGVHINSGIPNKAFYNTAVVTGHYKAGRIWYRALTGYLTANSQFSDLRIGCINSAKDLFGAGSAEETAVKNGFNAVGITEESGSILELTYDDGSPDTYVYENAANWQLAVKLTPPTNSSEVQQVKIYISADANNGTGHFSLTMFEANNSGLPGTVLLDPYSYIPPVVGWQVFDITNMTVTKDFFVSMIYDGTNWPGVGSDYPPGNNRAYEFDPGSNSWYKLTSPNDYTIFMRAKIKSLTSVVEIDTKVPETFEVTPNYPNPFNPSTTIRYSLPEGLDVRIDIFDAKGVHIAELANNFQNPGTYTITWNGKNDNGASVSSGVYYTRVKAGNYQKTTKMILMK